MAAASQANASFSFGSPPNYAFPDGFQGFALQTHGGMFNPGVLVGFNPQPDPPVIPTADVTSPPTLTRISLENPHVAVLNSPVDGGAFDFLIALLDLGDGSVMPGDPAGAPNGDGLTHFHSMDAGHSIDIFLQFGGSAVGSWSWGAFNPQPDPPGDFADGVIGFAADPFMGMRIEIDGSPLSFSLAGAPEPMTWALMILGLAGCGAMLRRARQLRLAAI